MSAAPGPVGTLVVTLDHGLQLLRRDPVLEAIARIGRGAGAQ